MRLIAQETLGLVYSLLGMPVMTSLEGRVRQSLAGPGLEHQTLWSHRTLCPQLCGEMRESLGVVKSLNYSD